MIVEVLWTPNGGRLVVELPDMVSKFDKFLKNDIRRQGSKWGAPMVATGDRGIPYTYPTGDSEDY